MNNSTNTTKDVNVAEETAVDINNLPVIDINDLIFEEDKEKK